jgi:hypothetical protein
MNAEDFNLWASTQRWREISCTSTTHWYMTPTGTLVSLTFGKDGELNLVSVNGGVDVCVSS